jgi:glycosyltransferase involved in cell wall biosynthesis
MSKGAIALYAGDRHIDETVRTGVTPSFYTGVRNTVIGSRFLLQTGHWLVVIRACDVILDLNPRSLSSWILLLARRIMRRRTLLWGHLHPRAGVNSKTASLRRAMRRLSDGTVLYGYGSVQTALQELPSNPVWVAPNSLYRADDIFPVDGQPTRILYVGRLEPAKKVELLVQAFAQSELSNKGIRLTIVGSGSQSASLAEDAERMGIANSVEFLGHIDDRQALQGIYSSAICSVSPGYAGLSLTQSLGFGVRMLVSRDEPHAPEIELARFGGVTYFDTDDATALAQALRTASASATEADRSVLSAQVATTYSAEAMAIGLIAALDNKVQSLGSDGWPTHD